MSSKEASNTHGCHLIPFSTIMDEESKQHRADPIGFLLVLIDSPAAGIRSLVQSTESLKLGLPVYYRAQKPSHYSFIGRKILQAHYFKP